MPGAFDLAQEIARLGVPDYTGGYSAPNTGDENPDTAVADSSLGQVDGGDTGSFSSTYAKDGLTTPAYRSSPNDFGWRVQDSMEVGAYRETCVSMSPAAGVTITLDYNLATVWEFAPSGSIAFAFPSGPDPYTVPDANAPAFNVAISLVVTLRLQAGAAITWPAGIVWPTNIATGAWTPPTAQRDDVYVLLWTPTFGWKGIIISQGFA